MKKIILSLTIAALAVAVQAGEACSKNKAACATKDKAACAAKAEVGCCAKKQAAAATCPSKAMSSCSSKSSLQANAGCPKAQAAKRRALMSPKALGDLASN